MSQDCYEARSLATIYILKILQEHSDADHCLSQQQIIDYLRKENISAERKKIARDIDRLREVGFDIQRGSTPRPGYYLIRDFDDSELRLLIDSVLCSKFITTKHSKDLVQKLIELGGPSFRKRFSSIVLDIPENRSNNKELFSNIDRISKAIEENRLIRFMYYQYDLDKELHPVWEEPVTVNPHSLVVTKGKYGLLAIHTKEAESDNFVFFYLDQIKRVEVLEERSHFTKALQEKEIGSVLSEHPFGLTGKLERVTLRIIRPLIHDLIESFGNDFRCVNNSEETHVTVSLLAGKNDILAWVLQNAASAEVLYPDYLREDIAKKIAEAGNLYKKPVTPPDMKTVIYDGLRKDGILRLYNVDLSEEDYYKNLEGVYGAEFIDNNLSDFSFLENYPNLRYLRIDFNPVEDLSVLEKLPKLERLELYFLEDLHSFDFLWDCPNLRKLTIINCTGNDRNPPFVDLPNLEVLNVTPYDLRDTDMWELYEANPHLSVQTEIEDIFSNLKDRYVEVFRNWDSHREVRFPFGASILSMIFWEGDFLGAPDEYFDWLKKNKAFQAELDRQFLRLGRNEYDALADSALGRSIRNISKKIRLSCEAVDSLLASALRIMRHPSCANQLRPFMPHNSPFAEEYIKTRRKLYKECGLEPDV